MKKIYSIVLMAVALLVSTNVNAGKSVTVPSTDYPTLGAAFADGTVSEIVLSEGINVTESAVLKDGRELKLDLGGNILTSSLKAFTYHAPIILVHGTLTVVNGTIENTYTGTNNNTSAILVFGAGYHKETGEDMSNESSWSNLIIGDEEHDINLSAECTYVANPGKDDEKTKPKSAGVEVYCFGTTGIKPSSEHYTGSKAFLEDVYNSTTWPYQSKYDGKDVAAWGVNITVKRKANVYGSKYGIQINGLITAKTGHVPVIKIDNGAKVSAHATMEESTGVYAAGVGETTIAGEVHGSTGVYVKSGEINVVEGAQVYSDNVNHTNVEGRGSGVHAGGSAIVYETNASYAGDIEINIKGGTVGSNKAGGYAIEGQNTTGGEKTTELEHLYVEGGDLVSGAAGCFETIELTQSISEGAEFRIDGAIVNVNKDDELGTLLELAGQNAIVTQTEDGEYVFAEVEDKDKVNSNINIQDAAATVIWNAGQKQTLNIDLAEVSYFSMGANTELTIGNGQTLKAGAIGMSNSAVIKVLAGGTLIITGAKGLVAEEKTNLLLGADATTGLMATFLMFPQVVANKTPFGTVEFISGAYTSGGKYHWQRFGVPAVDGIRANEIVKGDPSIGYQIWYWDVVAGDWASASATTLLLPFQGLSMRNQATDPGQKYSFPCKLLGAQDATLNLVGEWTSFANSYTAEIDLQAMLTSIKNAANGVSATAYVYRTTIDDVDYWDEVSLGKIADGKAAQLKLTPMQGFIFNNYQSGINSNVDAALNYEEAVWDPYFPSQPKAARVQRGSDVTRAYITITDAGGIYDEVALRQSDDFSAEFDNGYDAKKNLNLNTINIFANSELGDMAELSTNNLEGVKLSVATKSATTFEMTFSGVNGEQLAIRDLLTGSIINVVEGATYYFSVAENSVSERFEIVNPKNAPTAVETIVNNEGVKAVYTILGQFVGTTDNWNILPAGIYVVDGVKMVK